MKKLMMILTSFAITAPITNTITACHNIDKGDEGAGVPTIATIKANLKKQGYNVDNLDVDLAPGMKTAIIRFMPDAPNRPFLTKEINLKWSTNDISKIITFTSLPYENGEQKNNVKVKLEASEVLMAINNLNGTNFTFDDVDVKFDQDNTQQWIITPKIDGNFTGSAVEIVDEPVTFPKAFPLSNIGDIYITEKLWIKYQNKPTDEKTSMIAAIMEFVGDRNRFIVLYKLAMFTAMFNAILKDGIKLEINEKREGTLQIKAEVEGIINLSTLSANFKIYTTPRKFLNQDNADPTGTKEITVKLDKTYTKENEDELRYELVTKLLGKEFADQYKAIWYDEISVTFTNNGSGAIVSAKPGSKILAVSNALASEMTYVPNYKLNVTF
ncbi:Vmc-like lipoprotein signal peptide domain-containing protein [Spiroplasma endosymbiont of Polydrusus formosus]|uniref:Vmc-like lipoprotein signal peptide domain-containing protein n=1 Tax=Spiroplasma endosymbiont of Polydrusus formosus TaxID=3139326 RepID=UPI0035B510DC